MKTETKAALATIAVTAIGLYVAYKLRIINTARQWVGITEEGENAGFSDNVFERMMKAVGWKSGEAWCMYLAKAIHIETFPRAETAINRILTGSTMQSWQNAKSDDSGEYKVITSGKPKVGDIAIWQNIANKSTGHAGVVIGRDRTTFKTVEGNTNLKGSREGEKVLVMNRPLRYGERLPNSNLVLLGFIRKIPHIFD